MEKTGKFHSYLFEDILDSVKKKRNPDECELKILSNAWMLMGMLIFVIIVLGRMITDTLFSQGVLVCSISSYNEYVSLIFEFIMLFACFNVLSHGVSHWQVFVMMLTGLSLPFSLSAILMDVFSSAWPFLLVLPLIIILLITMEIVYRKSRNLAS